MKETPPVVAVTPSRTDSGAPTGGAAEPGSGASSRSEQLGSRSELSHSQGRDSSGGGSGDNGAQEQGERKRGRHKHHRLRVLGSKYVSGRRRRRWRFRTPQPRRAA